MATRAYEFHFDGGHGWLKVPAVDVAAVGLGAKDFSAYSYVSDDSGSYYLEQDVDYGKFAKAVEAVEAGRFSDLRAVEEIDDGDESPIRLLAKIGA